MSRVLPARQLVTVAHLRDPAIKARHHLMPGNYGTVAIRQSLDSASHDGATVCGLPLLVDEEWITWPDDDPAPTCGACLAGVPAAKEESLW